MKSALTIANDNSKWKNNCKIIFIICLFFVKIKKLTGDRPVTEIKLLMISERLTYNIFNMQITINNDKTLECCVNFWCVTVTNPLPSVPFHFFPLFFVPNRSNRPWPYIVDFMLKNLKQYKQKKLIY